MKVPVTSLYTILNNRQMPTFLKSRVLKPSHVSWFSFILLGLIVFGIGLFGTAYMINYLHGQLTSHEISHNQNVASTLALKFDSGFENDLNDTDSRLFHTFEDYQGFGFKFFILDQINQKIIFDSEQKLDSPSPLAKSWLANSTTLDGKKSSLKANTELLGFDNDHHSVIIWLQQIEINDSNRWALGVVKDQNSLSEAMNELHLHLNVTMLLIFVLITVLGYYAMRSTGRIYERLLESQLIERTQQLNIAHANILQESKLATIGKTATVLAHEMRNPLASIKLVLSALNGSEDLKDRENRRVNLVLGEVDRLDELLSETLEYAKPVKLSKKPVDLDLLLSQVMLQEAPLIDQKEIIYEHKGCIDCTAMRVDKAQFHQALLNLVKNAVEACPKGGLIETSLLRKDNELLFEISNAGTPLSEEVLKNAFEPFFTTKSKGTGLGLGLVKRVVDAHGGIVKIENNNSLGVKVRLTLPMHLS